MRNITGYAAALHRMTMRFYDSRDTGVRGIHYAYLSYIWRHEGCCGKDIAAYLHLNKCSVSRQLDNMEAAGLIERRADENDLRAMRIYPTEKSLECKAAVRETMEQWDRIVTSGLTEGENAILRELLEKVRVSAQEGLR